MTPIVNAAEIPNAAANILDFIKQAGAISIGGVTVQHTLENTIMGHITSPALKVGATVLAGIGASTLAGMAQGMPWMAALNQSLFQGLMVAGAAMTVHQTPIGANADAPAVKA